MGAQPALEAAVQIDASPDRVWAAVSDLKAMKRRSPELVGTWLIGRPGIGCRAINLNRRKGFVWPTLSRITRWKDPAVDGGRGVIAFHVTPTDVEWSYEIEPSGAGTLLTERRSALVDPSWSVRVAARYALGGAAAHDAELLDGMRSTLSAIKAEIDQDAS